MMAKYESMIRPQQQARASDAESAELWDREYNVLQVIPSSARAQPSKAIVLFSQLLNFGSMSRVLDLGSGIGRNAVYLAKQGPIVDAVEISDVAIGKIREIAELEGLTERIKIHKASIERILPFEDETYDLVLDSYVFCHFTTKGLKQHFRNEVKRLLRPGGRLLSSVFSPEDVYYRQFMSEDPDAVDLVTDPNNGITKQIYTESAIKAFYRVSFLIDYFVKFEFDDIVLGRSYQRSVLTSILRKQ